jgi:hypothetical protein
MFCVLLSVKLVRLCVVKHSIQFSHNLSMEFNLKLTLIHFHKVLKNVIPEISEVIGRHQVKQKLNHPLCVSSLSPSSPFMSSNNKQTTNPQLRTTLSLNVKRK